MAASYSSFLTTKYYSPVFNTALFDGPFRIYFSQSYETVALKIYHLLQTQDFDLWSQFKRWSEQNKKHVFILIYPSEQDVLIAFDDAEYDKMISSEMPVCHVWGEGLMFGLQQPATDDLFQQYYVSIQDSLKKFMADQEYSAEFILS